MQGLLLSVVFVVVAAVVIARMLRSRPAPPAVVEGEERPIGGDASIRSDAAPPRGGRGWGLGRVRIEYADGFGEVTERTIQLQSIDREGGHVYLTAYCELRAAPRQFRLDRVLRAAEPETGRQIEDFAVRVEALAPDTPQPVRRPPPPAAIAPRPMPAAGSDEHRRVMRRIRPGLAVLMWIAQADRRVSDAEAAVILAYVGERLRVSKSGATDYDTDLLAAWIRDERPSFDDAVAGAVAVAGTVKDRNLIVKYSSELVKADSENKSRAERLKSFFE